MEALPIRFRGGGAKVLKSGPLPDYTTRVNSIQNYQNQVRTVQLDVSISGIYGGLDRVGTVTEGLLNEVTWLSTYIQGTLHSHSKLEIREENSNQLDYVRIRSLHGNVGGFCKPGNLLLRVGEELSLFLDRAYDHFRENWNLSNSRRSSASTPTHSIRTGRSTSSSQTSV